jgi:Na+-driven multidrug efflux pump
MTSKFVNSSKLSHLFDVLRTSVPMCSGGVLSYTIGIAEVSIAGYISFGLIAAIGIGQLIIALPMSALMAITSANQAIFAKISGKILSSQINQRIGKLNDRKFYFSLVSISTSFIIGCTAFALMSYAFPALVKIMSAYKNETNDTTLRIVSSYITIARFSLLIVPITMGIKGILNGSNLEGKSLYISTIESIGRLSGLLIVAVVASFAHLDAESLVRYIALSLFISELAGLIIALKILRKNVVPSGTVPLKNIVWRLQALSYLQQAKSYLSYSSLQNVIGVFASLFFLSILSTKSPILASQFRMANSVFNFNRLVFNGVSQANAIVAVREASARGFQNIRTVVASTTQLILLASLLISLLLSVITYFAGRQENGSDIMFGIVIAFSFLIEGLSLIIFRLLLHFGRAGTTAAINIPPLIIFLIIVPIYFQLDPFGFSTAHLAASIIVLTAYSFIYWRFIGKNITQDISITKP